MDKLFGWSRGRNETSGNFEIKKENELLPPRVVDLPKGVLDEGQLTMYRSWMDKQPNGRYLFNKLLENLRFIGGKDMDESLAWTNQEINNLVKDGEYILLYDRDHKSGDYLTKKLNVKKPITRVPVLFGRGVDEAKKFKNKYNHLVYVNDAAYSGHQDAWMLNEFIEKTGFSVENMHLFYAGLTSTARSWIKTELKPGSVSARYKIPVITEIFSEEEQVDLQSIFRSWGGGYGQAVLTFFEHKVPDNFFGGLKRSIGEYMVKNEYESSIYLIDDTRGGKYSPPYHEKD